MNINNCNYRNVFSLVPRFWRHSFVNSHHSLFSWSRKSFSLRRSMANVKSLRAVSFACKANEYARAVLKPGTEKCYTIKRRLIKQHVHMCCNTCKIFASSIWIIFLFCFVFTYAQIIHVQQCIQKGPDIKDVVPCQYAIQYLEIFLITSCLARKTYRKNMILILANLNIRSVICLEMKHWYRTQKSRAHCDAHHTVHCSVMSECVWILPVVRPQGGWMAASLRIGPSPMNANSSLSRTSWIPAGVSWIMVFSSDILFHIFLCGSYWLVLNVSYVFDESTTVTW